MSAVAKPSPARQLPFCCNFDCGDEKLIGLQNVSSKYDCQLQRYNQGIIRLTRIDPDEITVNAFSSCSVYLEIAFDTIRAFESFDNPVHPIRMIPNAVLRCLKTNSPKFLSTVISKA